VQELTLEDPVEMVKGLGRKWESAWNEHDMEALSGLICENGDFVTVGGRWLKGRVEFEEHTARLHKKEFRDTMMAVIDTHVRFVRDYLAIVHVLWQLRGEFDESGKPQQPRTGIFTWVVVRKDGKWLIDASQNTNLFSDKTILEFTRSKFEKDSSSVP
jgi:uncharacterized protein (TIGR02246 family)